jgi:hypothetical protein
VNAGALPWGPNRATRQLAGFNDLKLLERQVITPELGFEVVAHVPWGDDDDHPITGDEWLDGREVHELADLLDDWLRGRGLR